MSEPTTRSGRQLFELLPMVYRSRDRQSGDLAAYLDAAGELLDRIRNTLDQRLADCFPEGEYAGRATQGWLLPYFARLLDVQLRSPHFEGRRAEVANAVAWRQRKGTAASIEAIAESVGQMEAEVHEGWRRVAVTPRIDMPRLPAGAFGLEELPSENDPLAAAMHPGLPAVTPDFRRASRAVQAESRHPLARRTRFPLRAVDWRLAGGAGVPCFADSYEDGSLRTADVRTPSWQSGHFHPRRILVYVPPPEGFFAFDGVHSTWADRLDHALDSVDGDLRTVIRTAESEQAAGSVTFTTSPPPLASAVTRIEGLNFNGTLTVPAGRLELRNVAARRVVLAGSELEEPVLDAVDCLFEEVVAPQGLVRLEGATVTSRLLARRIQASDSILPDDSVLNPGPAASCVRYSRLPASLAAVPPVALQRSQTTAASPVFFDFELCGAGPASAADWGAPGHAVLHPATPEVICAGAEDGGEMGAYHHLYYCVQGEAVLAKLADFVPVGLEVALIPDPRLLIEPAEEGPIS